MTEERAAWPVVIVDPLYASPILRRTGGQFGPRVAWSDRTLAIPLAA
jgi:hypothetical protein